MAGCWALILPGASSRSLTLGTWKYQEIVGDLGLPQEVSGGRLHETVFEFFLMKSAFSFYRLETQFSMAKCSTDNQEDRRTLLQLAKD